MRPTAESLVATVTLGIFSSAFGLMLFYMCLGRLGTLTTIRLGYVLQIVALALCGAFCAFVIGVKSARRRA